MNNINIVSNKNCTGCGACYNICPVDAISMQHNIDGFIEPIIDKDKCILCGKCVAVCPICNPVYKNSNQPECYAAMAANEELRMKSSVHFHGSYL